VLALAAGCARERRQKDDMFAGFSMLRNAMHNFILWATSHHGLAMQPADEAFSRRALTPLTNAVEIGTRRYRTDAAARAVIEEQPDGTRTTYPVMHAMGGKNIYYLLTPLQRGRLQVLPIAYDVHSNGWFDAAGSMIRHFNDGTIDEALHWRDPQLTFNTACFGCHVSQIAKNYDAATDTYRTVWREPGISCESCHGPGGEHIRVCRAAPTNQPPADLKLISMRNMTRVQSDETCATCHAKLRPLTDAFTPRDRFFDHYDLIAFESPDFYPDGRDLGEITPTRSGSPVPASKPASSIAPTATPPADATVSPASGPTNPACRATGRASRTPRRTPATRPAAPATSASPATCR
jgi:hypothetical protein